MINDAEYEYVCCAKQGLPYIRLWKWNANIQPTELNNSHCAQYSSITTEC